MIKKIEAYIRQHKMLQKGDHACVGVSGGADSVCLLLILQDLRERLGITLSVVHVEHGLRGAESLSDLEFVRALAKECGVAFRAYRYPVARMAKEQGLSLEEAGRNARREAYAKEASYYGSRAKIALAHHAGDNAETLLFHLCRGSGIEGMAGISPARDGMIRPLLCVSRDEIEAFLKQRGRAYCVDATNCELEFSRNRIRHCVMPELFAINARAQEHINQFACDAAEISAYLDAEAEKILAACAGRSPDGGIFFSLSDDFLNCPGVLKGRALLKLLSFARGSRKDFTREHVRALARLAEGRTGRRVCLPYGIAAEKTYGGLLLHDGRKQEDFRDACLVIEREELPGKADFCGGTFLFRIVANSKKHVNFPKNPYTKWFDYDKIKNRLLIRMRKPGDYFALDAAGHKQKLKDYWINEKVPRDMRGRIPLLADGSHVLWAVGYRVSEHYKVSERTEKILEVRYEREKA